MEPILTVDYQPVKRDYVRASRSLAKKSPAFLIMAAILLLGMAGSAFVLGLPGVFGGATQRNAAVVLLLVGTVYLLYYLVLVPLQLGRAYKTSEYLRLARTLAFFDSHIRMGIGPQSIELPWEHLEKVVDGGDYYLLIFEMEERIYPFIPGRALREEGDKKAFLDLLKAKSIPVI